MAALWVRAPTAWIGNNVGTLFPERGVQRGWHLCIGCAGTLIQRPSVPTLACSAGPDRLRSGLAISISRGVAAYSVRRRPIR